MLRFSGEEGFSRIFSFDVSFCTKRKDIDEEAVLASPAALAIMRPDGSMVRFSGWPTSLTLSSSYGEWQFWSLRLQPALWKLTQQGENRIFLDCTVEDMAKEILGDAAVLPVDCDFRLTDSYRKQEFSMQHNESLYDFLAWKLEREGIYYFFDETESGGRAVFADGREAHADLPGGASLRYSPTSGLEASHVEEVISSFSMTASPMPKRVVVRDYSWEDPMRPLVASADVSDSGIGDVYFYGDGFTTKEEGQRFAEIRAQGLRCRSRIFRGESAVPTMRPGFVFKLENYFDERRNASYLVTDVRHEGSQEAWLSQAVGVVLQNPEDQVYYRNSFACISADEVFRPERKAVRTKVAGMITAFIDGSSDSAVAEVNEKGCYKVVFPQDISNRPNGKSSCWIRRMQSHVGMAHGMTFPLTPGVEVLIAFIDGNPDRPVIAGAVANAVSGATENRSTVQNMGFRTPGGSGIVFNDKEAKQGLHLGTGGRSDLFMNSGSLDASIAYTDFGSSFLSGAGTSFAGLAKHSISGFSSKLEASHKGLTFWTGLLEALKLLSACTEASSEAFWHSLYGGDDSTWSKAQTWQSVAEGLTAVLKGIPAAYEAAVNAGALAAVDPFYGAAITAGTDSSAVKLTAPMDKVQIAGYLTFAALALLIGTGSEGLKSVASWLSSEKEIQEQEKKALKIYLQEQYEEELRKEHPEWSEDQIENEAKTKASIEVEQSDSTLIDKYRAQIDDMIEESGSDFARYEQARWHKMGRSIAHSAVENLIPEMISFIAVCMKSGKFTSSKNIGGLLLCGRDSNAVLVARKNVNVGADRNMLLCAGPGQSLCDRFTKENDLASNLASDFSLADGDRSIVMPADALTAAAMKDIKLLAKGKMTAGGIGGAVLTTRPDNGILGNVAKGRLRDAGNAALAAGVHAAEYGTDAAVIANEMAQASADMTAATAALAVPPPDYAELTLDGHKAKLDCEGTGPAVDIGGTALGSDGRIDLKMNNAGGSVASLSLKDGLAELKQSKGQANAGLSLEGSAAKLNGKDVKLGLDGDADSASIETGKGALKLESAGVALKSDASVKISGKQGIDLDGSQVSFFGGTVKATKDSLSATLTGSVKIDGGIIRIG